MESGVEKLQKIGLTEYEAKAYLSLLNDHIVTASKLSEKSGVPRTKIYAVLESLASKGWIKVYAGVPLLFKAVAPTHVFEKAKKEFADFLKSAQTTLDQEVNEMKERFVIKNFDIGLQTLEKELKKAKTIQVSNATTDFVQKINKTFGKDANVKVLLFPGERRIADARIEFKEAEVEIICMIKGKEMPSMSVILDESRIFTVVQDPVDKHYIVDEMLYDECAKCFGEWYNLGWGAAQKA
jgi:sugar-specific transcriptional regulator TrmB